MRLPPRHYRGRAHRNAPRRPRSGATKRGQRLPTASGTGSRTSSSRPNRPPASRSKSPCAAFGRKPDSLSTQPTEPCAGERSRCGSKKKTRSGNRCLGPRAKVFGGATVFTSSSIFWVPGAPRRGFPEVAGSCPGLSSRQERTTRGSGRHCVRRKQIREAHFGRSAHTDLEFGQYAARRKIAEQRAPKQVSSGLL